jgi:hypothetical protein
MSYSYSVVGGNADEVLSLSKVQFQSIVDGQLVHSNDQSQALEVHKIVLTALPETPINKNIQLNAYGGISNQIVDDVSHVVAVSISAMVSFVDKPEEAVDTDTVAPTPL